MRVALKGDVRGHVPTHFKPGEEVTIMDFRKSFTGGSADNIIQVSNGQRDGWVKPSNIKEIL